MSPDQAADLASRVLAAIERNDAPTGSQSVADYSREQVASDLAGLRWHADLCHYCVLDLVCEDLVRDTDGLLRTAALYSVTP